MLAGLLMDRVGAKPLYFTFALATAAILIPLFVGRPQEDGVLFWVVPALAFLVYSLGANGMGNCSQDYFFSSVKPVERLNLGVVFNISAGVAGFVGSLGGGAVLDLLEAGLGLTLAATFRVYFAGLFVLMLLVAVFVYRLPGRGSYSIRNTLSILFSPQDLRAVALLQRLDRSRNPEEERDTLRALAQSPSELSIEELLQHLRSPSFSVRTEALSTLRALPPSLAITEALITEVEEHHFTTAHMAAEILGSRRCREASAALRQALRSEDFMLCGKAMVALAQIGDQASFDGDPPDLCRERQPARADPRGQGVRPLCRSRGPARSPRQDRAELRALCARRDRARRRGHRRHGRLVLQELLGLSRQRGPGAARAARRPRSRERGARSPALERCPGRRPVRRSGRAASLARPLPVARPKGPRVDAAPLLAAAVENASLVCLSRLRFLVAAAIVWRDARGGRANRAPPALSGRKLSSPAA